MNIFVLDESPKLAASMHCDKHVPKMIVEHAQMMAAAYYSTLGISKKKEIEAKQSEVDSMFLGWPRKREDGTTWHYAISHVNHPCTIWTRTSIENFNWVLECTDELCNEFFNRWKNRHHSIKWIVEWMKENKPNLPSIGQTPFAMAMPICYQSEDAIESYRRYYAFKTSYMKVEWKKRNNTPTWWTDNLINMSISSYTPNPEPVKIPRAKKNIK